MRNLFDFKSAYGFGMESEEYDEVEAPVEETVDTDDISEVAEDANTQELQEDIPAIIDTTDVTNVVDDLGETFEEGNSERPVPSDIDFIPEDLKSEIDAIEAQADQHVLDDEGTGLMEEDPYHEIPGGVDLTNDTDETMQGFDKIEEYAASVDETKITGTSPSLDNHMREEYAEDRYDESTITGPSNNEVEISGDNVEISDTGNDPEVGPETELQSQPTGDTEELSVGADELDGDEDENEALQAKDVLGTESEDGEYDYMDEEEEVEAEDEAGEEVESDVEADDTDVEVEGESEESVEEVEETEEVSEDAVVEAGDEESCCAEEHAIVDSLDVDLHFDEGTILPPEAQEEAEQSAEETEVEIPNEALNEVSEMTDVNSPSGDVGEPQVTEEEGDRVETATIDDETLMSDVIGDKVAETSHGDEDSEGFWEGDIPVNGDVDPENPEQQLSEGDASYDDGAGSEGGEAEEMEEAEDVVEEDVAEADTTEEVDTPEEVDVELESADEDAPVEDVEEYSEEVSEDEEEIEE